MRDAIIAVASVCILGGCPLAGEPPPAEALPDTFVGNRLDVCVSSSTDVLESLHGNVDDGIVEYAFSGEVRSIRSDENGRFAFPWTSCSDASPNPFVIVDSSTGADWLLSADVLTADGTESGFRPSDGTVLAGRVAADYLRTGASQLVIRDESKTLIFGATSLVGGLFDDEQEQFGFVVAFSGDVVSGEDETICGIRREVALAVSCANETVVVPSNDARAVCGVDFTNVSTWIPEDGWTCTDRVSPTIWYVKN